LQIKIYEQKIASTVTDNGKKNWKYKWILSFPAEARSMKHRIQNIRGLAFDLQPISFFLKK
jgi:hypothetical protein